LGEENTRCEYVQKNSVKEDGMRLGIQQQIIFKKLASWNWSKTSKKITQKKKK